MIRTLIKNAKCVLPEGTRAADLLIEGDTILDIDPPIGARVEEAIDAAGLHLLPGVIDAHVHFRDPGVTHKEDLATGSRACAKGGVTTFLEMPNTRPATTSVEALTAKLALAEKKSLVNFGFYIGATPDNLAELQQARRTPGIKIYIGSSTGSLLVDRQEDLERIFAETTLPIAAHCEDEATITANRARLGDELTLADHSRIRDPAAARIATARALDLARRHEHRFHVVHVTTAEELPLIADHKKFVTAEVCPHHLFFNIEDYKRLGSRVQMNPSIKTQEDNAALWRGLREGVIDIIATDHAPHTLEEKSRPYPDSPSGLPAVENSLALMLNQVHLGHCTLEQVVAWMCSGPARVWNVVGKGLIAPGMDADLVLVDLNRTATIRDAEQVTKCRWSPWDGVSLTGWPTQTFVHGRRVFAEERFDTSQCGREARFDHRRGGHGLG